MSNKAKIYLYKEGNECATISGGWTYSNGTWGDSSANFSFNKNSNCLAITVTGVNNTHTFLSFKPSTLEKITNINISQFCIDMYSKHEGASGNNIFSELYVNGTKTFFNQEHARQTYSFAISKLNDCYYKITNRFDPGYRVWANIYNAYIITSDDIITVPSQNQGSIFINLNSLGNLISFKNLTLSWNGKVLNTYNDISATDTDIEYALNDSDMFYGDNEVTVQVKYNQGDGLPDETLTMIYAYNKSVVLETVDEQIPDLIANTSPREFLDRIYMVNDVIDKYRNNMYKLLEYKGFQVEENLRLNDLIILVWNMIYEGSVEETIRQKMITVLISKGVSVTGNETISELIDIVNTKL